METSKLNMHQVSEIMPMAEIPSGYHIQNNLSFMTHHTSLTHLLPYIILYSAPHTKRGFPLSSIPLTTLQVPSNQSVFSHPQVMFIIFFLPILQHWNSLIKSILQFVSSHTLHYYYFLLSFWHLHPLLRQVILTVLILDKSPSFIVMFHNCMLEQTTKYCPQDSSSCHHKSTCPKYALKNTNYFPINLVFYCLMFSFTTLTQY